MILSLLPNISEVEVFVIVKTDILNDFSKLILSTIKTLDKINRLMKKEIKIKNQMNTYPSRRLLLGIVFLFFLDKSIIK